MSADCMFYYPAPGKTFDDTVGLTTTVFVDRYTEDEDTVVLEVYKDTEIHLSPTEAVKLANEILKVCQ